MPRRPPPTPLRLATGPLPGRGEPKHTLPSMPRPAFVPPVRTVAPRARATARTRETQLQLHMDHAQLRAIAIPLVVQPSRGSFGSRPSTPTSAGSSKLERSRPSSPASSRSDRSDRPLRAPWNHSESIQVPFDVSAVLAAPQRAALNPPPLRC